MNPYTRRQVFSSTSTDLDRPGETETRDSPGWYWFLWLALAATFVFVAAASFAPDKRLWGLNHLAFYPARVRILALSVAALFFVPLLSRYVWEGLLRFFARVDRALRDGTHYIALTGLAFFVLFAALRSSTLLLGDGRYIINNFQRASDLRLDVIDYFQKVTLQERIYPATELLNFSFSRAASNIGAVSHASGVWILSCLIGTAFVVATLLILKKSTAPAALKMTLAALVMCTGAVELFFGYVENYTPVLVLGVLFVLTSYRSLEPGRSLLAPAVLLAASVLFHVQAVLLAPAFFYLVLWRLALRSRPSRIAPAVGAIILITAAAMLGAGRTDTFRHHFLAPVGTGGSYAVFSPAHLLDVLNEILLLCPVALFFAASSVRREPAGHGSPAVSALGWCLLSPALLFLLLFNPALGMARDWDLFAFTALGLVTPGLLALARKWPALEGAGKSGLLVPPALALGLLVTASWVGVNASPERSAGRYRSVLQYDQTNPGYAYETLSDYYEDRMNFRGQIEALEKAYAATPNPRYLAKLGTIRFAMNELDGAERDLRAALAVRPDFDSARRILISILIKREAFDDLITVCREGISVTPASPAFHFFLGQAYLGKGDVEEALKAFDACSRLNPPAAMKRDMTRIINSALEARKESGDR